MLRVLALLTLLSWTPALAQSLDGQEGLSDGSGDPAANSSLSQNADPACAPPASDVAVVNRWDRLRCEVIRVVNEAEQAPQSFRLSTQSERFLAIKEYNEVRSRLSSLMDRIEKSYYDMTSFKRSIPDESEVPSLDAMPDPVDVVRDIEKAKRTVTEGETLLARALAGDMSGGEKVSPEQIGTFIAVGLRAFDPLNDLGYYSNDMGLEPPPFFFPEGAAISSENKDAALGAQDPFLLPLAIDKLRNFISYGGSQSERADRALKDIEKTREMMIQDANFRQSDRILIEVALSQLDEARELVRKTVSQIDQFGMDVARVDLDRTSYTNQVTIAFSMLVGFVIFGFFFLAWRTPNGALTLFGDERGLQFITLFALIIAIILFGVLGILEGKELAALLGGLSGYILGRSGQSKPAPAAASPAPAGP